MFNRKKRRSSKVMRYKEVVGVHSKFKEKTLSLKYKRLERKLNYTE